MITHSESGLDYSQYEGLLDARSLPALKVLAYQYNPSFSGSPHSGVVSGGPWRTVRFADYNGIGYRIRGSTVESVTQSGTVTNLGYSAPGTWVTTEPLEIVADSTGVAVFAVCTDGLKRTVWNGSTWSSHESLGASYTRDFTFYTDTLLNAQGAYSSGINATFAFDNVYTNYWSSSTVPAQLGGDAGTIAATRYRVVVGASADAAPKSWTFEGWNGASWITLDTKSNQPAWFPFESRSYEFTNATVYSRYRINVSAVYTGTAVQIAVLEVDTTKSFSLPQDITLLAAASPTVLFYLREVPERNVFQLNVAEYEGGAWVINESDIWFPGKFPEMHAIAKPEGGYIIVAQAYVPGPPTFKSTGAGLQTYVYKKQGVISFLYENKTFSDHFEVDISDFYSAWRKRQYITLTVIDGLVYMVVQVTDGTEEYPNAMYQVYTTKDGRFWSIGEAFYVSSNFHSPIKLFGDGTTIMALMDDRGFRSPHTRIFGGSAVSIELTDYIEQLGLSFQDISSGSMILENSVLQFDSNPNFNINNMYEVEIYAGYYVNGVKATPKIFHGDIESIEYSRRADERVLSVSFVDLMNRINERFKSRNAREIRTHLVFQDDFTDSIDNVYGGLRNTASQEGQWESQNFRISGKTGDGVSTTQGEAIAFSTATIDAWNGEHEAWINFQQEGTPTLENSELWYIFYTDEPRKYMQNIWTTAQVDLAMGWTPPYFDSNEDFYGYIFGYIKSKAATGLYNFKLQYAGQASVYINNTLIINGFEKPSASVNTLSGEFDFDSGTKWYPLYIPFSTWPKGGLSAIKLLWSPPGEAEALVPAANLAKAMQVNTAVFSEGLVFRAIDKKNFYSLVYVPTTERISLRIRRDGIDKEINSFSVQALGYDNDPEAPRKFHVVFRYALVEVYAEYEYSGPVPILRLSQILDMRDLKEPDDNGLTLLKDSLPEAGYVGYIARGV